MRILILDTYYHQALRGIYEADPQLRHLPYEEQWKRVMDQCFGTSDFYSRNLRRLGHEAVEVIANCLPLQKAWSRQNRTPSPMRLLPPVAVVPRAAWRWNERLLVEQAKRFHADVVHIQDPLATSDYLIHGLRKQNILLTTQIASAFEGVNRFRQYDVVFSSLPNYVTMFRQAGLRAEYMGLGFESTLNERIHRHERYDIVFVGGVSSAHPIRNALLEAVAARIPLHWWGYGVDRLPPDSVFRRCYQGPAWGLAMYQRLAEGRICINKHEEIAGDYANNMRLFEATGVGTLLITDTKKNLPDLFQPGREVVTYATVEELVELVQHYLHRDDERRSIAAAGQERTLRSHSYFERMKRYLEVVEPLYAKGGVRATSRKAKGR